MSHTIILPNYDMVTFAVTSTDVVSELQTEDVVDVNTPFDPSDPRFLHFTEVKRSMLLRIVLPAWGSEKLTAFCRGSTFDYDGESWVVMSYAEKGRTPPFAKGEMKAVCYFPVKREDDR